VEKVYNLELEPFSTIDIVRDAFIFQCYTALRYSDVSALKKENIIKTDEGYELDILTEKDDDRVRYPLSSIASKIYEKYAKYEYVDEKVFPLVSNQKYNKHLKEIGKMAELQGEWISYQYRLNEKIIKKIPKSDLCSHTARRTFITLAIESGVSSDLIAQITSHSEIEAMKPYLAKTKIGVKKVIDALDKL
jgi:integrase